MVSAGEFSKELCGGTHLENTSLIGIFKVTHEGSVASGIRRIEAVTGKYAYELVKQGKEIISGISKLFNLPVEKLLQGIEKKAAQIKELEGRLKSQIIESLKSGVDDLIRGAQDVKGVKFIAKVMKNLDMGMLRKNVDLVREKTENAVIALSSAGEGRSFLVIGVTPDLAQRGLTPRF